MIYLKAFHRPTVFSCAVHAVVLVAVGYLPLEAIRRFTTSGQRQVISIEMSIAAPMPFSTASTMSAEVTHEPTETIEAERSLRPSDNLARPDAAPSNYAPSHSTQPLSAENPIDELPQRVERVVEMPTVANVRVSRPRSDPSIAIMPVVAAVPVDALAGLAPTDVEFHDNPPPKYPTHAAARGIEGTVLLKLYVNREGKVSRAEVLESSGSELLDHAALAAVKTWSGKPATRFGRPIETAEVLPVRFRL
ncbi:energy transducer TonB [Allorhodopirellula heiligendammensis]|uniref:Transport protein TonB n=1 Tax=Allorhodopirellula heiligendammensis TaxID=2714739 RepID=A0A5C6BXM0_9BACT|nr:energy transducer TonB [Allorhodopirellula heiligendammensis]TWU16618.1 transport protein TonB [Allorhodopirellula heiligendammensis]